nr:porin [Acetobacter garciniae]
MRRNSFFPSLAFSAALMAGIAPIAQAAPSDDAQLSALKAEMAEMRREMMGQISSLKAQLAKNETNQKHLGSRLNDVANRRGGAYHSQVASGPAETGVQFGEEAPPHKNILAASGIGRPPSDRGDTMSWKDFRAATQADEEVRVGGMIVGFPKGRFTISSEDGAYGFSVGLAFHEDFGGFLGSGPRGNETRGDFSSFTENARRIRIPFTFRYKDWVANVTPDFGAGSADGAATDQTLYEANLNYTGLHNTILTVGYFQPRVTEEDSESSNDFEMMERPAITDAVRKIAAGDARFSFGGLHYEKRWWIAAYFTGQSFGNRSALSSGSGIVNSQTGGTFRAAGRPYMSKDIDLHVGVSAISAFKVAATCATGSNAACSRSFSFGQSPEVNLTTTNLAVAAVSNASSVWAAGPELGFRWKNLLLKGEYYHIGVTRGDAANVAGQNNQGTVNLEGYYGSANYTLFGKGRAYNEKEGAFGAPGVEHEFDPRHGSWGALELTGRYSVTDFHDVGITGVSSGAGIANGTQQTVWSGGLNWYPNRHFRVMLDFNHFMVTGNGNTSAAVINEYGRTGNSLAARVQAAF